MRPITSHLLDEETILSSIKEWKKLEEEWGSPVDLETEDDILPSKLEPEFSTLDLKKTTFNSSFLVRRKIGRKQSKKSVLDYKDFIQGLDQHIPEDYPAKQFYFVNGQILSALSVEDICDKIDDMFKSIEMLSTVTSTVRHKKKVVVPEIVQCSISIDSSFDDTVDSEKEKCDIDDVDAYIDEAFEYLNSTLDSLRQNLGEASARESVTTLVRKFTSILKSSAVLCNPRRQRVYSNKLKDLADYWKSGPFN